MYKTTQIRLETPSKFIKDEKSRLNIYYMGERACILNKILIHETYYNSYARIHGINAYTYHGYEMCNGIQHTYHEH